ncbi:MAG: acyl-CoA dehydrogenase family protein [Sphingomonadales bacterium]
MEGTTEAVRGAAPRGNGARPLSGTPLERVARLKDVIARGGDEAQKLRRLPNETVDALVDEGLFRFAMPAELGGENASTTETIEILEAISAIDASVGWNVMLGSEINAMAAGGMEPALAREVYLGNPRVIMCGGGGPGSLPSRAEKQKDGSYKVWGEATFISGVHNAEWCFLAAPIVPEGQGFTGNPLDARMWFLHKSQYEIIDVWDMAGLRGSGSNTVRADGAVVPEKYAEVQLVTVPPYYDNPVFRIPTPLRLSYNKVAVALGVAKGAIDSFIDLANNKIPFLSASKLTERPIAQHRVGEMVAKYRAARAYVMEAMKEVEDELWAGADQPGPRTTQNARLACTHGANACMEVVDVLHNTAGTSGMQLKSPLERKLRDAHGCATHRWVAHPLFTDLGKILLGHEAPPEFAGGAGGPGLGAKK